MAAQYIAAKKSLRLHLENATNLCDEIQADLEVLPLRLRPSGVNAGAVGATETPKAQVIPVAYRFAVNNDQEAAMIESALNSILNFWMMRGGGKGGDEAISELLFTDGRPVLDAQALADALQKSMGVNMGTLGSTGDIIACCRKLLRRLCASGAGASATAPADVVSSEAMLSWIHARYPAYQHEQVLNDLGLHLVLARHNLPTLKSERSHLNFEDIFNQSRESVKANVQAAVDEITDRIYGSYKELQDAHKGALSSSSNAKFAGDNLDGTFEGAFESEEVFHAGLDKRIGLPSSNPLQGIIDEHQNAANSHTKYRTSNYNLTCTPAQELQAAYGCDPAESFPGTGTGENKRKIVHLRILLAATGCLRKERWASMIHSPTLKHLEKLLGPLVLSEEDKVHEAMVLLMQANERFSNTINKVQAWLQSEVKRTGKQMDMPMLFAALKAIKGWDTATTQTSLDWGRELFKIADLCPEEVIALRLYTGPQFAQYNAVLRNFPKAMLDLMHNNGYTTTIHCINSGLIRLARASPLTQRRVYRGSQKMRLPRQFAAKDKLGHQCIVEMGFLSTTTKKDVALDYASGGAMSMLLVFERGAVNCGASLGALSFYKGEEEICFPPLCILEAAAPPQMSVNKKGVVLEVYLQVSVNQHSDTIDVLVQRRKFLHMGMLRNLQEEVARDLRPIDDMVAALGKLGEKDASTLAGARHDLEGFAAKAREVCKGVCDAHRDTAALDFNQDEKFGELVNRGATMKRDALNGDERFQLMAAVFSKSAKTNASALKAVWGSVESNAWTDLRVVDEKGRTPLLEACRAGSVEIVENLIKVGADAAVKDMEGRTPLLEACQAGNVEISGVLIKAGADVRATGYDGSTPLSNSILSGSMHLMELVTMSIAGYPSDPNHDSYMQNLAQAYLQCSNLEAWIRGGTSLIALQGHIGALLSSSVKPAIKDQLSSVRVFLNHNKRLLEEDPSQWPVEHTVLQLASQEPDGVFAHTESMRCDDDDASLATKPPLIDWLNKPARHRCRLTMRARDGVKSVVYSKCGSKLVRAEGNHVVVCDAVTGFVESTMGRTCARST